MFDGFDEKIIKSVQYLLKNAYSILIPILGRKPPAMLESFEDLKNRMVDKDRLTYLFYIGKELVGSVMIRMSSIPYIERLAVKKKYQRKGIGTWIKFYILNKIDSTGVSYIEIETFIETKFLIDYYKKFGFEPRGVLKTSSGNFQKMVRRRGNFVNSRLSFFGDDNDDKSRCNSKGSNSRFRYSKKS